MISQNNKVQFREQALLLINQGINKFNGHQKHKEKKEGFDTVVQGIKYLSKYLDYETNQTIKKQVQKRIEELVGQAEKMKREVDKLKQQENVDKSGQQKNVDNNSNSLQHSNSMKNMKIVDPNDIGVINPTNNIRRMNSTDIRQICPINNEDDKLINSLISSIVSVKPDVQWNDIIGLENAKGILNETITMPIKFPDIFKGVIKPWKGILLYGPPGTGKTYLAQACATECKATFFSVSSSDLMSKYVGESEKMIRLLFRIARNRKPSIIFIDEIDSMASSRTSQTNENSRRVKTQFLVQMEGIGNEEQGVLVLAATNHPWELDNAILRRFEKKIYIPMPDQQARLELLQTLVNKVSNSVGYQQIYKLAQNTEGYSAADLSTLVKDANYGLLRECGESKTYKKIIRGNREGYIPCLESDPYGQKMQMSDIKNGQLFLPDLKYEDLLMALGKNKATVNQNECQRYQQFTVQCGMKG